MTLTLKQLIKLGVVTPIRRRRYRARKQIMRDNRNTGDYIPPVVRSVSEMRGSSNIISPNQGSASFLPYTDVMRIRDEQQQQFIRQQEQKRDLEAQRIALEDYQQEQQGKFEKAGQAFQYVFSRLPSWENDTYGNFGEVEGSDTFQVRGTGVQPDISQREKEKQALMYDEPTTQLTEEEILSSQSPRETSFGGVGGGKPFRKGSPRTAFERAFPSQAVGGGMVVPEENVRPSQEIKKIEERVQSQRGIRMPVKEKKGGEDIEALRQLYKEYGGENPKVLETDDITKLNTKLREQLKAYYSLIGGDEKRIGKRQLPAIIQLIKEQEEFSARQGIAYLSSKPSR